MHLAPLFSFFAIAALSIPTGSLAQRSTQPTPRNVEYSWMSIADWYRAHADDVEQAAKGEATVVFAGDSITQGWQWAPSWQGAFAPYNPLNLGIGGDKTENLLWRLQNSATGQLDPKVAVLLIGVNNFGHSDDSAEDVYAGVRANIQQLKSSFPNAKLLTLSIFPYEEHPGTPNRKRLEKANKLIAGLEDETVTVLDVGHIFLEEDGTISKTVMGDFLHPTAEGYERLTGAVLPVIERLLD